MTERSDLAPQGAPSEIDRANRRVRQDGWWPVAASVLMAVFSAAFYIGLKALPETAHNLLLPDVVLAVIIVGVAAIRRSVVNRGAGHRAELAVLTSVGLALVTIYLNRFVMPDDLTPLAVHIGLLPSIPFAVYAWWVARSAK
ncbi:hypothetical protein [Amycolatopsis taiwanensis]|uniref:hypothetical protein n=1 Tax=Amycolatopsis taiwanensis TaxID=342230 RepID=UPI000483C3EB|nr:hypothetical protein [Amycolatopsis taiwanensis]